MRPENDNQDDLESGSRDDYDEETSYKQTIAKEAFITGFASGAFLTMGVTFLAYVIIPGESCP